METLLFCTSYIPSTPDSPDAGIERWQRWIEFYSQRKALFGAERLILIDDGSPLENLQLPVSIISADTTLPTELPPGIILFRFSDHLGRSSMYEFPGWWRSFAFAAVLARTYGVGKLIHIESDAYVISHRLADYMSSLTSGWTTFMQAQYRSRLARVRFPRAEGRSLWSSFRMKTAYLVRPVPIAESALQVICADQLASLHQFWQRGLAQWGLPLMAEQTLPFTAVESRFVGNRYGELGVINYPRNVDFVTQARVHWSFADRLIA